MNSVTKSYNIKSLSKSIHSLAVSYSAPRDSVPFLGNRVFHSWREESTDSFAHYCKARRTQVNGSNDTLPCSSHLRMWKELQVGDGPSRSKGLKQWLAYTSFLHP